MEQRLTPITHEILTANGFEVKFLFKYRFFYCFKDGDTNIEIYLQDPIWGNLVKLHTSSSSSLRNNRFNAMYNYDIVYVHQLQAALKLFGINLELKV